MGHLTGCTTVIILYMYYFEDIIEEIEKNLTGEISISALARMVNMSVYEFRRIFSFVAKIPVNEYIRKRRLSLAALELRNTENSVTDIALKYGYDTPSSFSRAFKEYHGVSPKEAKENSAALKLLSKIGADIVTTGGIDISYRFVEDTEYTVFGYGGISDPEDTECCENVWQGFYDSGYPDRLEQNEQIYVAYSNENSSVKCVCGRRDNAENATDSVKIPQSYWVVFSLNTTNDEDVNRFYKDVITQWLEATGYERNYMLPNIEIYPVDMEEDGFEWEIRLPVKKKG